MNQMDPKLKNIIKGILDNEDSAGCSDDLTVTTKYHCDQLRAYMKKYERNELIPGGHGLTNADCDPY